MAAGDARTTDSAGVIVHEYGGAAFNRSSAEATLQREFQVGWRDQDPEFGFISVGLLLRDGGAIVYDDSWHQFVVVDATGQVERRFGRVGDGPGEFRSVTALKMLSGDSILVYDGVRRRVSVLDPEFRFIRSFNSTAGGGHIPSGITRSNDVVWTAHSFPTRLALDPGLHWLDVPVLVGSAREDDVDSVLSLPLAQVRVEDGRTVPYRFRPTGWTRGHPDGVVWSRNDRPEVRWFSAAGDLMRIARWGDDPVEVTDRVWSEYADAYVAWSLTFSSSTETGIRRAVEESRGSAASHLPFFGALHVGSDGSIWLSEYVFPGRSPDRFLGFGAAGEWIGVIQGPAALEVLDISGDLVLGVEHNELDVPAVGLYRVEREEPAGR